MFCWITIFGGVLVMMGQRPRKHRAEQGNSSHQRLFLMT